MRKIREVLRLAHEHKLSIRQVSRATGIGKSTVGEFVARAKVIGITWPIPPEISDAELEARLFTPAGFHQSPTRPVPDWAKVHQELKRCHVTLMVLREEYRAEVLNGHGYSRYYQLYSEWKRCLSATMRQTHLAGDKLFADWAGDKVPIIDQMTGEVREASIFVAVMGASSYAYSEGLLTEALPDWISAHVNTLHFIRGVMKAAVPDNLNTGITKPSRYEPGINRTYQRVDDHTVIVRFAKPTPFWADAFVGTRGNAHSQARVRGPRGCKVTRSTCQPHADRHGPLPLCGLQAGRSGEGRAQF